MNYRHFHPWFLAVFALFPPAAPASVTVFDSFSEGSIAPSLIPPAAPLDLDRRTTFRVGSPNLIDVPTFIAGGVMTYSISLRGAPSPMDWFQLVYSKSTGSSFNLLEVQGFNISITNLIGEGELELFANSPSSAFGLIPITSTGELPYFIPTSNLPTVGHTDLFFRFHPKTQNFSITVDQVTLIPEPSGSLMIGAAVTMVFLRRRRVPARILRK